jgi:peptide/nickel transport system substrate-binding protein
MSPSIDRSLTRRRLVGGVAALGAALLAGRRPLAAQGEPGAALADRQELRVGISRNLVNGEQDPWYCHSSLMVWEPLIGLDDALRPVPGLAEAWAMAEDGLSWTLTLRPNVAFADGVPFDADAVLANVAHLRQVSGRPSSFFNLDFEAYYGAPTEIVKVDPRTVRIVLPEPRPSLPNSISNFFSAMFSPASFTSNGDFVGPPVATGPFRIVEWARDQGIVLERNDRHWGRRPSLDRIALRIYPDPSVRVSALRAGEVDALLELGPMLPAQGREMAEDRDFVVTGANSSCSVYLSYNGFKPPFADLRMRRAVDLALDRETIVRDLVFGFGVPGRGTVTTFATAVRSQEPAAQVRYDPGEAQTLAQQVLGDRRESVTLLFSPPAGGSFARPLGQIAAFLQATLAAIGLDVELRQLEAAAATDVQKAGDFHFRLSGGPGCFTSGDPDYVLRRIMHSGSSLNARGDGNGGYANPEVDRLLDEARGMLDPTARRALYDRLQEVAVAEVPISLIYDEQQVIGHRADVRGLNQRITYQPTFDTAYFVR